MQLDFSESDLYSRILCEIKKRILSQIIYPVFFAIPKINSRLNRLLWMGELLLYLSEFGVPDGEQSETTLIFYEHDLQLKQYLSHPAFG